MQAPTLRLVVLTATIAALSACNEPHSETATVVPAETRSPDAHDNSTLTQSVPMPASAVAEKNVVMTTGSRIATRVGTVAFDGTPPALLNRENYADTRDNGIQLTRTSPVSTFSIDVDTGSYSNVRRLLRTGNLPPKDAVRTEELLNYFAYDIPSSPQEGPFQINTEVAPSPWNAGRHLLRVDVRAVDVTAEKRPASNLVFLVDVSGSMQDVNKLELLKKSLKLMTQQTRPEDSIAIVAYANGTEVILEPTKGDATHVIGAALDRLHASGGTNGGAGIELAYSLARQHFIEGGINRVLIATDGDFNVGITDFEDLLELIKAQRKTGIGLTTLGFGAGNYNDHLMEQLADAGNGNHAYIDTLSEARKVLVDQLTSTLHTVASDVKIQIEFNASVVSEYRLVGYENRMLAQEDFNNDKVDAGDIGAGHSVTALYELALVGGPHSVEPLRYGTTAAPTPSDLSAELAFLKLRYKAPGSASSTAIEHAIERSTMHSSLDAASENLRFSAAVAGFGQVLRGNETLGDFDFNDVLSLASAAKGNDPYGYRGEFIDLVRTAQALAQL